MAEVAPEYIAALLGGKPCDDAHAERRRTASGKKRSKPGKAPRKALERMEGSKVLVINIAAHKRSADVDTNDKDRLVRGIVNSKLDKVVVLMGAHHLSRTARFLKYDRRLDLTALTIVMVSSSKRFSKCKERGIYVLGIARGILAVGARGLHGLHDTQVFNPLVTHYDSDANRFVS